MNVELDNKTGKGGQDFATGSAPSQDIGQPGGPHCYSCANCTESKAMNLMSKSGGSSFTCVSPDGGEIGQEKCRIWSKQLMDKCLKVPWGNLAAFTNCSRRIGNPSHLSSLSSDKGYESPMLLEAFQLCSKRFIVQQGLVQTEKLENADFFLEVWFNSVPGGDLSKAFTS